MMIVFCPYWPMIIFRVPKDGRVQRKILMVILLKHHFVLIKFRFQFQLGKWENANLLVDWLKSYKPEELFNEDGSLMDDIKAVIPKGDKRMAANPITNAGGNNARILRLNDIRDFAVPEDELKDSSNTKMDTRVLSDYIADIMKENPDNFRMWGPDETKSNRFYSVLDEDKRQFMEIFMNLMMKTLPILVEYLMFNYQNIKLKVC